MLEIEDLYKSYSTNEVLKGLNLKIEEGQIQTVVGSNGSGKSTLINIVAGLIPYNKGVIKMDEQKIEQNTFCSQIDIGYVFERPLLIEQFSVMEFLEFVSFLQKMDKYTGKQRIIDLCNLLEIPANKMIEELSKGQKMKVAISAALIHNPNYLILDEPFNGIDFMSSKKICLLIKKKAKAGASILITTHQYNIIFELSDKIAVLNSGKIAQNLNKEELFKEFEMGNEINHTLEHKMLDLMASDMKIKIPEWLYKN